MSDPFHPEERYDDQHHQHRPQESTNQQNMAKTIDPGTSTFIEPLSPSTPGVTLPHDLLPLVARHARDAGALRTLARMRLLSTETSSLATSILYENLSFATVLSNPEGEPSLQRFLDAHTRQRPAHAAPSSSLANETLANHRQDLFDRVGTISLEDLRDDQAYDLVKLIAPSIDKANGSLFPSAHTVVLGAFNTVFCDCVYDNFTGPWSFLQRLAQPERLCIPDGWDASCSSIGCTRTGDLSRRTFKHLGVLPKLQAFLSEFRQCWPSLKRVYWGPSHVRYPNALAGVENVYDTYFKCPCGPRDASAFHLWSIWVYVIKADSSTSKTKFRLRGSKESLDAMRTNLAEVASNDPTAAPGRTPIELDIVYEVVELNETGCGE